MIEAWLRLSLTMRSVSPVIVGMTPVLAVKPLWNVRTAGVPLNSASSASSASCIDIVPAIVRTAPGADAELADRLEDRLAQARVVGEPEVVVGGEADEPPLVHRHDRALGAAHDPQRAVEVALAQGRHLVLEEGERIGRGVVVIGSDARSDIGLRMVAPLRYRQSMITLPDGAGTSGGERRLVLAVVEAVGDGRRDVQPGLEHHRHLVPGLVHLAAVDAADRQLVEDDAAHVDRDLLGRDAEHGHAGAVGHAREGVAQGARRCPDISSTTSKPSTMPSSRWTSWRVRSRGSTASVAPMRIASSRRKALGSLTTM